MESTVTTRNASRYPTGLVGAEELPRDGGPRAKSRLRSRLRSTVVSCSLIVLLGATTPSCPFLDFVFGVWMGGPYAEFALTCAYGSDEDLFELVYQSGDVGGVAAGARCGRLFFSIAGKTSVAGEEIFYADNFYRVAHRMPAAATDATVIDYGRVPAGIALDATGGYVYWADFRANQISRATLDGSTVEPLPITGLAAASVAFQQSTGMLYWTTGLVGKIQKGNTDGTNISDVVTGLTGTGDIALDEPGGKMYWANFTTTGTELQRANLDGTSIETIHTSVGAIMNLTLDIAGGKIYWSDAAADEIRRANLDGTSVEAVITATNGPTALALDAGAGKIYWYDADNLNVRRANLDGSSAETIAGFSPAADMALDLVNGHVFFSGLVDGQVKRMNLDGTSLQILASASRMFGDVAIDESRGNVYWLMQTGELIRSNYDGSTIDTIATGVFATSFAFDQATDKLYWASGSDIKRSDPDGSNMETPVSGITFLSDVTVDGAAGYIYWIEQKTIGRANLDGSGAGTIYTDANYPNDLAAHNGLIYWSVGDMVRRMPGAGPYNVTDVHTGLASPYFLDVTDNHIYWHQVFTDLIQRSALDGTNIEDVAAGFRISGLDVAGSGILPVELVEFRGVAGPRSARLFWRTSSEANVSGFEVEQFDPKEDDWMTVGFESAASTNGADYTHEVVQLEPATYLFRLRIVDTDGATEYSPVVEVAVRAKSRLSLSPAYPNPFTAGTSFSVTVKKSQAASIDMYDVLGRRVRRLFEGQLTPDTPHSISIYPDGLAPGPYFVQVRLDGSMIETRQVIYVR